MKVEKKRLSLYVPAIIYDRLNTESEVYGVPKTTIVLNALLSYYREVDSKRRDKDFKDSSINKRLNSLQRFVGAERRQCVKRTVEYRRTPQAGEDMPQKPLDA